MGHGSNVRRPIAGIGVAALLLAVWPLVSRAGEAGSQNAVGIPQAADDGRSLFDLFPQDRTGGEPARAPAATAPAEPATLMPMLVASDPDSEPAPKAEGLVPFGTMTEPPPMARDANGPDRSRGGVERPEPPVVKNFPDQIEVAAGQSVIVQTNRPTERVAIADPEVADVVLVSPTEVLINGRGRKFTDIRTGEPIILEAQTSLILWDKQGRADVRALYINKSKLAQIEMQVTVAELNRTALERQGFDFSIAQGGFRLEGRSAKIFHLDDGKLLYDPTRETFFISDSNNGFFSFIELLQRENLGKVLARPTLVAKSGEYAKFKTGGEVPIPLITQTTASVEFKEFGVILEAKPVYTDDNGVDLQLKAELSAPDKATSTVSQGGFVVPAFVSRRVETRVRLRDGQSLLLAGLMRDDETETEEKVPYLGDIPYVGALFRNTSYDRLRTELLILVQPRIVKADRDDSDMPLPTRRGSLTRSEVRTKPTPNPVARPRIFSPHRDRPVPMDGGATP